jgi:electron transfer flavoprotein alpha subunit
MKALLIGESREGKLVEGTYELLGFAAQMGMESAIFMVGSVDRLPAFEGRIYLADAEKYGEYNPDVHKSLILEALRRENPDYFVFLHSSYGWDLAPRVAAALGAPQVSEITDITPDGFRVLCLNGRMRRTVKPLAKPAVLTIQAGAFTRIKAGGTPLIENLETAIESSIKFIGFEKEDLARVDLGRAGVIVGAGRGVGKEENIRLIAALAKTLGGELGATRPVVDAGWLERGRQVGSTGQTVAPRLYLACGISGAIHHLAGMKGSEFIIAINRDREAPIGEVADVLVVADVVQLLPELIKRLKG